MKRVVVGAPNGDLTGDGSSVERAQAVEALVGIEDGYPVFRTRWVAEPGDLEALQDDGRLELIFWSNFMPVHAIAVHPKPPDVIEGEASETPM
jgi:hypothetical protein